jgi:peptide deformylase
MAARRILQLGDPILREVSREVTAVEDAHSTLDDLADTLHDFQRRYGFGRGIAAIQVGVPQRVIYIEIDGAKYELINPRIVSRTAELFRLWDDCFSFPELMVLLDRHLGVTVEYLDRAGKPRKLEANGAFAELLQHEIDHLEGVLAIDRALDPKHSFMTRTEYLRTHRSEIPSAS